MTSSHLTAGHLTTGNPAAHHLLLAVPGAGRLVQHVGWAALLPVLVPALGALAVLVADLFLPARRKPLLGWATVLVLAAALACLVPLRAGDRRTFCLGSGTPGPSTSCSYAADHFALVFQLLVLGGALIAALLSQHSVRREKLPAGEFWFLLLSSATGAALLPASRDLATLTVALEVTSLPAFALVGLRRDGRGGEAALKFFLSSVAATAVMLLGIGFLYGATGTMYLDRLGPALDAAPAQLALLAKAGALLTLVGFAFKTAAAPFHFWVPDTYVGAPVPVAAYLSVVGKAAGIAGLALVTVIGLRPYGHLWGTLLAVLAAATMTVGNAAALRQRTAAPYSAVRLLAWSSVAQAGYLLVPLAAAGFRGGSAPDPRDALGATAAYALVYGVVNLGAFAVVAGGGSALRVDDFRGLFSRRPALALAMAFFLLCLAGLPPGVVGLFGKVVVFRSAIDAGLGWLAVVMALNVVVALYYYVLWTARLFAPAAVAPAGPVGPAAPSSALSAPPAAARTLSTPLACGIAVTLLLGVVLSVYPQLVLQVASGSLFG
ncbi:NADH-quinone oxidoreductase subunit N [Phaeacidiphilus oryzae]|uniref:NADH-quinone oxidoreductase subunit N n=1 Tax=Phaeacidiphilus oryzae TaxID=348818 RepID=UPI003899ADE0